MNLWEKIRRFFGGAARENAAAKPTPPIMPEADEDVKEANVPEMSAQEALSALQATTTTPMVLLDIREPFEWKQVHIATAGQCPVLHIPMNDLPNQLAQLPKDRQILVLCAHGNRSHGVTHWLRQQGYWANNLKGGITQWARQGGPVQTASGSGGGSGNFG